MVSFKGKRMNKLAKIGIAVLVLVLLFFCTFKIARVNGNQMGVMETWTGGVISQPYFPKTYFLFRPTEKLFVYDVSSRVYVMNDKTEPDEPNTGREKDSYLVQSSEGQDLRISTNVRWRIDTAKVVEIHKNLRENIEEKILRPELLRVIKDEATTKTAIDAYSGSGLVALQNSIYKKLSSPEGHLASRGIIVENFVIEHIALDAKYIGEITERQVAIQRKLKADEMTKAAEAEALRAKADAQADLNKQVVAAERDKQVGVLKAEQEAKMLVLKAEATKQQVTLAAEAEKIKLVTEAEGDAKAGELRGIGILALGKAEAEAQKLRLSAYAVPGADAFVKVEIAKQLAVGFGNIRGYLPADMKVNMLTTSYMDSLSQIVGPKAAGATALNEATK